MNYILTHKGVLRCCHRSPLGGKVNVHVSQNFVRINGGKVNLEGDTENCSVNSLSCAIITDPSKNLFPCKQTKAETGGYSSFVTIEGQRICLDSVTGETISNPEGGTYSVRNPGQRFVSAE